MDGCYYSLGDTPIITLDTLTSRGVCSAWLRRFTGQYGEHGAVSLRTLVHDMDVTHLLTADNIAEACEWLSGHLHVVLRLIDRCAYIWKSPRLWPADTAARYFVPSGIRLRTIEGHPLMSIRCCTAAEFSATPLTIAADDVILATPTMLAHCVVADTVMLRCTAAYIALRGATRVIDDTAHGAVIDIFGGPMPTDISSVSGQTVIRRRG